MAEQDTKTIDHLRRNNSPIITSANNKELKKADSSLRAIRLFLW